MGAVIAGATEPLDENPLGTFNTKHVPVDISPKHPPNTPTRNVACPVEARIHGADTDAILRTFCSFSFLEPEERGNMLLRFVAKCNR